MKTNKKRIAVSILTVFMMVFSVIPYMGAKAAPVYAASEISTNLVTDAITDANGALAYEYSFVADDTNYLNITASRQNYTGSDSGGTFTIKIVNSAGAEVATASTSNGILNLNVDKMPSADTYKLQLYSGQNKMGSTTYNIQFNLKGIHVYTYKYTGTLDVHVATNDSISVSGWGSYDGDDACEQVAYRENVKTGAIAKAFLSIAGFDDAKLAYDTEYKYYVLNYNRLSSAAKAEMPTSSTEKAISAATKAELEQWSITGTVKTAGVDVGPITDVKVWSKGVRWVELGWIGNGDGYQLKSYDKNGKLRATVNTDGYGLYGTKIYVAYDGPSKVTIQPYVVVDGVKYWGKTVTASGLTSAKLKASGGNVTKMSNT